MDAEREAARDALFGQVFATPAGARLLEALAADVGRRFLTLAEIDLRLARCRKRWATGPSQT